MDRKIYFLAVLVILSGCTTLPRQDTVSKIPITQNGEMSTVVLALVERQNFITEGNKTYNYPDGLVFFFVIYPEGTYQYPTIREAQNFTIDGEGYWQNLNGSIDSHTVIYNQKTFALAEPEISAKLKITKNGALIQKTIICGDPLPEKGIVHYRFFFGFDQELEEFDFRFRLQDIR